VDAEAPEQILSGVLSTDEPIRTRLRALKVLRDLCDQLEEQTVAAARDEGVPWQGIADDLGRGKSWAWKRYAGASGEELKSRRRSR
jgi:hypothetical protein